MTRVRRLSTLLATCGLVLTLGCAATLDQEAAREAKKDLPPSWGPGQTGGSDAGSQAKAAAQKQWDTFFADPYLKGLIKTALTNNQELNLRLQEIIIARNEVDARRGEYLPKLNGNVGAGLEKAGEFTREGAVDKAQELPEHMPNFKFGLSASWEVDVWGKLRNAAQAANTRYLASIEAKNFVVTQIVAEIANSYYELVALDKQIEVLERNVVILEQALKVIKLEKLAARATELAVQKFQAEVLKFKSRTYVLAQQRVEVENRINFLVGRYPQHVARTTQELNDALPGTVVTGVPTALLENRPDVRQAEMQLEAAKLDVQVARARFLPSLSIDAGAGYRSFNAAHLVDTPQSLFYDVAGNLIVPLLNRTAIEADYRSANARQIQAVYAFERTLLGAYTEVANSLARSQNLRHRNEQLSQQVKTLREATEVSNTLYRSAHADYMEVLLTRRDALEAEMDLIETKQQRLQATVKIYQSLGGGWQGS